MYTGYLPLLIVQGQFDDLLSIFDLPVNIQGSLYCYALTLLSLFFYLASNEAECQGPCPGAPGPLVLPCSMHLCFLCLIELYSLLCMVLIAR